MAFTVIGCGERDTVGAEFSDEDLDGVLSNVDCDDTDPTIYPGAPEIVGDGIDQDCDGVDAEGMDADGDGFSVEQGDCDDQDPTVHPAAVETPYDGIDQDCDGSDLIDADADGFVGMAAGGDDCHDGDPEVHPGADELPYNHIDDDCNPATPDDDLDGDGFGALTEGDCDDDNPNVHPFATEVPYDGVDQDCSGSDLVDVDQDGFAALAVGGDDCDDHDPTVRPSGVELCDDGVDQDCDGTDQSCSDVDADGDGYSPNQGDCNDLDPTVSPGAAETPYNGRDDDCDPVTPDDDLDQDGFLQVGGGDCDDGDASVYPGAAEIPYDGVDQDCSGSDLADLDQDGFDATTVGGADCDDTSPQIHPDARELPHDGVDQNCDGSDYVGEDAVVLASDGDRPMSYDVAAGAGGYLVVYAARPGSEYEIYAQRVTTGGALDGAPIDVSGGTGSPHEAMYPTVASDGTGFLVAWHQSSAFLGPDIVQGQIVDSSGGLVGGPIVISGDGQRPQAAFGGGRYMVVWTEWVALHARPISPAGTVFPEILVSSLGGSEKRIASNGADFMITYGQGSIYARGVSPTGTLTTAEVLVYQGPTAFGGSDIASDGTSYLVAIEGYSVSKILGQIVASDGTLPYTDLHSPFVISDHPSHPSGPVVVSLPTGYEVVWGGTRHTPSALYGQKVDVDGTLLDTTSVANHAVVALEDISADGHAIASIGEQVCVVFNTNDWWMALAFRVYTP